MTIMAVISMFQTKRTSELRPCETTIHLVQQPHPVRRLLHRNQAKVLKTTKRVEARILYALREQLFFSPCVFSLQCIASDTVVARCHGVDVHGVLLCFAREVLLCVTYIPLSFGAQGRTSVRISDWWIHTPYAMQLRLTADTLLSPGTSRECIVHFLKLCTA